MKLFVMLLVLFGLTSISLGDDLDIKLEKVLYPCVRVLNGNGGGSGTVLYSEDREQKGEFQTYILTNHHVIDILLKVERQWDNLTQSWIYVENNELADVELFTYANGGKTVTKTAVKAEIVAYVADEDMALLRLMHPFQVKYVAKFLPVDKKLRLFQNIYAVGCPLLVDPVFTYGEITDLDFIIDKKSYIGGSADIIWGNSGGYVITQIDGEYFFCGVPSRGLGARGQFLTYMGYYVPPERIRTFFISQKLDFLVDPTKTPTQCFEERSKLKKNNANQENEKQG